MFEVFCMFFTADRALLGADDTVLYRKGVTRIVCSVFLLQT